MVTTSNLVNIEIERQQVLRNIGYNTRRKPPARVVSLVDQHIDNAHQLIKPSYSYVVRNIERVRRSCVFVEGSIVFESEVLARLLEQCTMVVVFLVTIGDRLEEMVCRLAGDGLVLEASVLDTIGSVAAEQMAESVHGEIRGMARTQGLCTSRRFSPGYCDWDVSQQKMVFRAMKGDCAGVKLNDGCLMLPRKSISGIIGLGPREIEDYNPCITCDKVDCVGRR